MLTSTVPQWMEQNFIRSALAAGASASREDIADCYQELLQLWSKPDRYHHDIRHLIDMLQRVDVMAPETPHADRVRLAAWFHGIVFSTSDLAVYTRNGGEDELASAKLAATYMQSLGIDEKTRKAVTALITGLKKSNRIDSDPDMHGPQPDETSTIEMIDMDQLALSDAHMGSLAVEPQKYKHYLEEIHQEYAHIPHAHFLFARKEIVTKLLARKKLFLSPLAAPWENPARENLEAELERLNSQLRELDNVPVAEKRQHLEQESDEQESENQPQPAASPAGTEDLADSADSADAYAAPTHAADTANDIARDTAKDTAAGTHTYTAADTAKYSRAQASRTKSYREVPEQIDDAPAMAASQLSEPPTSSLEKLRDIYSPGPAPRTNLSEEEALRVERKKIAEEAWQEIERNMNKDNRE